MYNITHIIFDLDGTLINSSTGIYDCMDYAFKKLNEPTPTKAKILSVIGLCLEECYKEI